MVNEIGDIRLFSLIVEADSLSEAARRLQWSLTTVSRRLTNLERRHRRPGVRAEDFDVVIQTKRPTDGDVIHRKLLSSRRVVCATPQYIERHGAPISPS